MLTYVNLPRLLLLCVVFGLRVLTVFLPTAGQSDPEIIPSSNNSALLDSASASSPTTLPSFRALLNSTPNISLQSDRATVYLGEQPVHG